MDGAMRKRFQVRKYKHPRLKFVLNYREDGKRKRKFFETKEAAKAEAALKDEQLRKSGLEGAEFSSRLRVMAGECAERLLEHGKTIAEATDFLIAHLKATKKSCKAAALVEQLIAAKKAGGASKRYLEDLRNRLDSFASADCPADVVAKTFGERMVATITSAEIDDWLDSLKVSAITRNNYRRVLLLLFGYAVKRSYATSNPAAKTEEAKVVDSPPGILTVAETVRLLENASTELLPEKASTELLPYVAIGLFAGLRRAELERLDWSEIDFDENLIEVTAKKAKTARRRLVEMQPNLREWLLPVRKHAGKITPANFRKQFEAVRTAARIPEWPDNALRHSFASYHIAHFKDAKSLALEMGHTTTTLIFSNYRQLVKPKEAEKYWNIKPIKPESEKDIVQFAGKG
jgi:integrase